MTASHYTQESNVAIVSLTLCHPWLEVTGNSSCLLEVTGNSSCPLDVTDSSGLSWQQLTLVILLVNLERSTMGPGSSNLISCRISLVEVNQAINSLVHNYNPRYPNLVLS